MMWRTYFLATRPAFLTITLLACLIGFAVASYDHHPAAYLYGFLATVFALCGHGAGNVINDYYDALNGSDAQNENRISPFTGGSRFIQNNLLTVAQAYRLAVFLFLVMAVGGLMLSALCGARLLFVGAAGLFLGWCYSAEPLKLMARGIWGEIAIVASWFLIVVGADLIGEAHVGLAVVVVGLAFAFPTAAILFVNQIPDRAADRAAGKMTLAVKADPKNLWVWYLFFTLSGCLIPAVATWVEVLPMGVLGVLGVAPVSAYVALRLRKNVEDRALLTQAIKLTILATHVLGVVLAVALLYFGPPS